MGVGAMDPQNITPQTLIKFDAFENVEDLTLILCNPGCYRTDGKLHRGISAIPYVTDVEFTKKYNGMSELAFRVTCVEQGVTDRDRDVVEIFNMIEKNRYIYIDGNDEYDAFFRITECEYTCENGERCKDVRASSREYDLTTRNIPYIPSGVYKLCHYAPLDGDDFVLGIRETYNGAITESTASITTRDPLMQFDVDTVITPSAYRKMFVCKQGVTPFWTNEPVLFEAGTSASISLAYDFVTQSELSNDSIPPLAADFMSEELNTILGMLFHGTDWDYVVGNGFTSSMLEIQSVLDNRYRSFDGVSDSMSIYDFLMEKVQAAYECVFTFSEGVWHGEEVDGVTKPYQSGIVHVDLYDTIGAPQDDYIFISQDTFVVSGSRTMGDADVYTAMRGSGGIIDGSGVTIESDGSVTVGSNFGDNANVGSSSDKRFTIAPVNPLGGNIVYNFSRYYGWMSDSLRTAVMAWDEIVSENEDLYIEHAKSYYRANYTSNEIQRVIDMYTIQKDIYERCAANLQSTSTLANIPTYNQSLIEAGADPLVIDDQTTVSSLSAAIAGIISDIDDAILEQEEAKAIPDATKDHDMGAMNSIRALCSFESNFTQAQFNELVGYINEADYTDDYVAYSLDMSIDDQILAVEEAYRRTKNALSTASQPIYQYTLDINGYMFVPDQRFQSVALACTNVGKLIHVDIDGTGYQTLFITEVSYNYEDKTCTLTVASTLVKSDVRSLFRSVFDNISAAYTTQYRMTSR